MAGIQGPSNGSKVWRVECCTGDDRRAKERGSKKTIEEVEVEEIRNRRGRKIRRGG